MKRLIYVSFLLVVGLLLTGCNTVPIKEGEVGLQYTDLEWVEDDNEDEDLNKDGNLELTIYVTNGTEEEYLLKYLHLKVLTADGEHVIGEFNDSFKLKIKAGEYAEYLISFEYESLLLNEEELIALGYNVEDINDIEVSYGFDDPTAEEEE